MKFAICLFMSAFHLASAAQAPTTWKDSVAEAMAFSKAGKYEAAVQAFREALAAPGTSSIGGRELVAVISGLATAYAEAGRYVDSEHEWRNALAIVERDEGRNSLDYALILASLASLPTQAYRSEETIAILRHAIGVNSRTASARDLAVVRGCLAHILVHQSKYAEAEALLLDSQSDFARLKITDPLLAADLLDSLGLLRGNEGRLEESVDLRRESLRLLEGAVGAEHASLVVPLNNLAYGLVRVGRLDQASAVYQRGIALCSRTLGEDHPGCGALLENYAFALRKLGHKREAREMSARAKQIREACDRRNGTRSVISITALDGKRH